MSVFFNPLVVGGQHDPFRAEHYMQLQEDNAWICLIEPFLEKMMLGCSSLMTPALVVPWSLFI